MGEEHKSFLFIVARYLIIYKLSPNPE